MLFIISVINIFIIFALRPNPTSFFVLTQKTEAKKVKAAVAFLKKLRLMTKIV